MEDIKDYAIFRVDPEGRIATWNVGAQRVKGYTSEEAIGQPFSMLFTPEDVQAGKPEQELRQAAETGVYQGEGVRLRKGGIRFCAEVTLRTLSGPDGSHRGFVKVTRDITERKRIEQQLRERAEFEQQLIGIVSHDLRTPISAVLMASALLLRSKDLGTRHAVTVGRILTSAERAHRLIGSLLDFTQARLGGGLPIQYSAFDMHRFVALLIEELELARPGSRLRFEASGEGSGEWDSDRVAQLITNLVNNALSHGAEGGLVTVRVVGGAEAVMLSVHNRGAPISPQAMSTLFEPMQRDEGAPRTSRSGSIGLGMFIVKHIVQAHGGTLDVESTQAGGTTVTVRLPRHPPPRSAATEAEGSAASM
ncbi:PAS domain-containing sensor histidine kinase [Pyxidicoccus xibeiensis]|uniref:PAS domain-containing sensor histidine kinase n=1 Tax=Pyxidicoccus xibeiensis TaxID=2906759 RepID=UPI0020A73A3B|nr:PAS domain-containing sensor histidine kinase [Pyxidicoccus xibeiensis]MCP3141810.1 PAS domain-containing sensor histidine kinase [Pyxidicoccus xibeiensis]